MNEISAAIYTQLKAGTALCAMLYGGTATGTADIYEDHARDDRGFPFVILNHQSGQWSYALDGARFGSFLYLVKAVSSEPYPRQAQLIDKQIDARLHNAALSISGYHELRVVRESDVRFSEIEGEQQFWHVGALYRVEVQKT